MAIEDKILKIERIDWRQLKPLQPEDIKHVFNYQAIEDSILEHGFVMPFAVWQDDHGDIYTVDGHTRFEVLSNMEDVPDTLPALFIKADNRQDAIRILLDVYNQKQNPIDREVLMRWLDVEEIQVTRVEVRSLNLKYEGDGAVSGETDEEEGDGITYSEKNKEVDVNDFADTMKISLTYSEDEYWKVKEQLSKIAATPEAAVWKLLGNE